MGGVANWIKQQSWKLVLTGLVFLGSYCVYLDAKIQSQLSNKPWQLPSHVFARSLVLAEGDMLNRQMLEDELALLSYRKSPSPSVPGEYSLSSSRLVLYRRGFNFPTGYQADSLIDITITDSKITAVVDRLNQHRIGAIRIEPWLIGRLHTQNKEDRIYVPLENMPESLIQGLTLVEDKQFFDHYGLAPLSILRALLRNVKAGKAVEGGSTLTQQLIKNIFLTRKKSLWRKVQEALMALLIEARFSKNQILELYLNEVYLGQNGPYAIHGFGLASQYYFNRPLNELKLHQVATLVGMVKGPFLYHPIRAPENARGRRDLVLRLMLQDNLISKSEYERQVNQPLATQQSKQHIKYAALLDQVKRELRTIPSHKSDLGKGLSIYTDFDPHLQQAAQQAISQSINKLEARKDSPQLQGAMVITDYHTGQIKALVGDKQGNTSGFNRALDAHRPIGSLIKPLIYLHALEQANQFHLGTLLKDEPIKLQSSKNDIWEPKNADRKYRGQVTLLDALSQSLNVPTVNLGMQIGVDNVAQRLESFGIEQPITRFPALLLGSVSLSPFEVSQMFQPIANNGELISLHSVRAIMNDSNQLIWLRTPHHQYGAEPDATQLVKFAMQQVVNSGTGKQVSAHFPNLNLAGKTGTTDDNRDSWFIGMEGQYNVVTWIGNDDNLKTGLSGASGALQAYLAFAKQQTPSPLEIDWDPNIRFAYLMPTSGQIYQQACASSIKFPYIDLNANIDWSSDCSRPDEPVKTKKKKKSFWQRLWGKD